jgi:hypothetical protein
VSSSLHSNVVVVCDAIKLWLSLPDKRKFYIMNNVLKCSIYYGNKGVSSLESYCIRCTSSIHAPVRNLDILTQDFRSVRLPTLRFM